MLTTLRFAAALLATAAVGCDDGPSCDDDEVEVDDGVCVSAGAPPGYTGPSCDENEASFGGGEQCSMSWVCGVDTLRVDCEQAGSGFACTCHENAVEVFTFFSANICAEVTEAYRGQVAADRCAWPVAWDL